MRSLLDVALDASAAAIAGDEDGVLSTLRAQVKVGRTAAGTGHSISSSSVS
jgi:hypothetical protein